MFRRRKKNGGTAQFKAQVELAATAKNGSQKAAARWFHIFKNLKVKEYSY
jgi:hypothetical protein